MKHITSKKSHWAIELEPMNDHLYGNQVFKVVVKSGRNLSYHRELESTKRYLQQHTDIPKLISVGCSDKSWLCGGFASRLFSLMYKEPWNDSALGFEDIIGNDLTIEPFLKTWGLLQRKNNTGSDIDFFCFDEESNNKTVEAINQYCINKIEVTKHKENYSKESIKESLYSNNIQLYNTLSPVFLDMIEQYRTKNTSRPKKIKEKFVIVRSHKIQIIKPKERFSGTLSNILSNFDLSCCKIAMDGDMNFYIFGRSHNEVYGNLEDILGKKISLYRIDSLAVTIQRLQKYMARGYTLNNDVWLRIVQYAKNLSEDDMGNLAMMELLLAAESKKDEPCIDIKTGLVLGDNQYKKILETTTSMKW